MSKALNAVKALVANWEKLKVARSSESDLSAFGIANLSFETLDRVFANWDLVIASLDDKNIWATSPELALADQPLSAALNDISGLLLNAAGNGIGWLVSTHFFTRALEIQTHITAIASRRIAITREVARVLEAKGAAEAEQVIAAAKAATEVTALADTTRKAESESKTALESTKTAAGEVESNRDEAQRLTSEIASWAKIAEENKTSITATAAAMDELRKKSSHDQNELLSRTAQLEATIKDMQKTADAAIASVQQALKSARDEGLAKSFQNRSKKLRGERLIWSVLFIAAVAGLAWASIALARELLTLSYETLIVTVLRKAAIAGPAIWLGWYSARQVGRTARIQEDYEYKAASALAYQSYKEEAQRLGDSELIKDLLKTAISTFGQNPVRLYDHAQGDPVTPMDALTKKLTPEQLTAVAGLLSSFPTQKK